MTAKPKPVTRAEAKEVWEATPKPSIRKVAERFKQAGRSISYKTIGQWKREGWSVAPEKVAKAAVEAKAKIDQAAVAVTKDPAATAEKVQTVIPALDQNTASSSVCEDGLRDTIHTARNMLAVMQATAPTQMLTPSIAGRFITDIATGIATCVEALTKLPSVRTGEMKTIGGQEVLQPESDPLSASIEAFREETKRLRANDSSAAKN